MTERTGAFTRLLDRKLKVLRVSRFTWFELQGNPLPEDSRQRLAENPGLALVRNTREQQRVRFGHEPQVLGV